MALKRKDTEFDEVMLYDLAELFRVFGDSTRIKILCALIKNDMNVTQLTNALQITQPAVSQQLKILKINHLVKSRREGQSIVYSLDDSHVKSILNIGLEHLSELQ